MFLNLTSTQKSSFNFKFKFQVSISSFNFRFPSCWASFCSIVVVMLVSPFSMSGGFTCSWYKPIKLRKVLYDLSCFPIVFITEIQWFVLRIIWREGVFFNHWIKLKQPFNKQQLYIGYRMPWIVQLYLKVIKHHYCFLKPYRWINSNQSPNNFLEEWRVHNILWKRCWSIQWFCRSHWLLIKWVDKQSILNKDRTI